MSGFSDFECISALPDLPLEEETGIGNDLGVGFMASGAWLVQGLSGYDEIHKDS